MYVYTKYIMRCVWRRVSRCYYIHPEGGWNPAMHMRMSGVEKVCSIPNGSNDGSLSAYTYIHLTLACSAMGPRQEVQQRSQVG